MLQEAMRKGHGCEPKHTASVPVEEVFQGKKRSWIEVFDLIGHPKAKQGYAWGHAARDTGNEVRMVTVIGLPPVDSPCKAVQVSILSDMEKAK
jgi:hypothetical protein